MPRGLRIRFPSARGLNAEPANYGLFARAVDFEPAPGVALPGSLTHGQLFTVEGPNFGAGPELVRFSGGAGGILESREVGESVVSGYFAPWEYVTPGQVVLDATRGKVLYRNSSASALAVDLADVPFGAWVYLSSWVRRVPVADAVPAQDGQHKIQRLMDRRRIENVRDEIFYAHWTDLPGVGFGNRGYYPTTINGSGGGSRYPGGTPDAAHTTTGWVRFETEVRVNNDAAVDGRLVNRVRVAGSPPSVGSLSNQRFYADGATNRYRAVQWQNFFGNGWSTAEVWHDDHYAAIGLSRVELTNAATWGAETLCEVQPFASWSNTAVQFIANVSHVPSGSYWLHVIGPDGVSVFAQPVTVA
jgi:hypothetical protein